MSYPRETQTAMDEYLNNARRVEDGILSMILKVNPEVVVDIDVGESTQNFILDTMKFFIALDVDYDKLLRFTKEGNLSETKLYKLEFICADAYYLPLRSDSIDLVLLHFVLHEINPRFHCRVLTDIKRVSRYILIVEPTSDGTELYRKLWSIWRDAMRSIGRFEEYRMPEYWLQLLNKLGICIVKKKIIKWEVTVPYEVLKTVVSPWVREWRQKNVPEKFVKQLKEFLEEAKVKEFKWSDIFAVLASKT